MSPRQAPITRAERRRRTEERILDAARRMFAAHGYDRTTIRAVAAAAGADPGLVMRYFGSKEGLFSRAACLEREPVAPGTSEELAEFLLSLLVDRLTGEPTASLAALRSMLTHPEAAESVRASVTEQLKGIRESIPGDEAALRSGLVGTVLLGVVIGRVLLELDELTDASPEQIRDLLRPCVQALVGAAPAEAGPAGAGDRTDAGAPPPPSTR